MNIKAEYAGAMWNENDELVISFKVEDDVREELKKHNVLSLDIKPYKKSRSLNANAYFWQLCDKIAKVLKSDKETIYLMKLKDAGTFEVIEVIEDAIPLLTPLYRMIDIDHYFEAAIPNDDGEYEVVRMASLHCYRGSHEYNTEQMSNLIESTVSDAADLGIETMTPDELEHLCSVWRQR